MTLQTFLAIAWRSLVNRRATAFLTILSVALSVTLFLGVDKIRRSAETSFAATISGTDLIVGARSGQINLLLYSVFRIGNATTNISWESYEDFAGRDGVEWTIPLSLGDSHQGFRVLGTNADYFTYFQYGANRSLSFATGTIFDAPQDAVLGAEVARSLGYDLGDELIISHGLVSVSFADHQDKPFIVTGILAPTGTPVDRTVHVSLSGLEAVHAGFPGTPAKTRRPAADAPDPAHGEDHDDDHAHEEDETHGAHGADEAGTDEHDHDHADAGGHDAHATAGGHDDHGTKDEHDDHAGHHHEADQLTAFMVGLKNRTSVLALQRAVNTYEDEALLGIIPGLALTELWSVVGVVETALLGISLFVVAIGLMCMLTAILTSLNERRREIAVLRAAGARRGQIFSLLVAEAALIALLGSILGGAMVYGGLHLLGPMMEMRFGLPLTQLGPSLLDLWILLGVVGAATLLGFIPAWRAYQNSLADGLTVKL